MDDINDTSPTSPAPAPARRLRRTREGRVIAGVCSGLGEFLNVDPNIIRLVFAILTLFGGSGVIIYLVGWLLIPEEDSGASIVESMIKSQQR